MKEYQFPSVKIMLQLGGIWALLLSAGIATTLSSPGGLLQKAVALAILIAGGIYLLKTSSAFDYYDDQRTTDSVPTRTEVVTSVRRGSRAA